jgi:hypothetical protein
MPLVKRGLKVDAKRGKIRKQMPRYGVFYALSISGGVVGKRWAKESVLLQEAC